MRSSWRNTCMRHGLVFLAKILLSFYYNFNIPWTPNHQWLHFSIMSITLADLSRNRSSLQWAGRLWSISIFFWGSLIVILIMINGRKNPLKPLKSYLSPSKTENKWDYISTKGKSQCDGTVRQTDSKTDRQTKWSM